jgi:ubiquinone/menaquinone biosynthesis C-methylase UbiE
MTEKSVAFDRAAGFYDETRGFPDGIEKQAAALIAQVGGFKASHRVLEIGIGTGRIALPLAAHVGAVYGIDLARPMMERLVSKRSSERVHLAEGSAEHLPFASQQFDGVVAVHVFHLIPGWRTVLNELTRVLKPDAPLIHAWGHSSEDDVWTQWGKQYGRHAAPNVGIRREDMETFLEQSGWRLIGEKQTLAYTVSISPASYLERLEKRIFSATWQMTDEQIAEGVALMKKLILDAYGSFEAPIVMDRHFSAVAYLPG